MVERDRKKECVVEKISKNNPKSSIISRSNIGLILLPSLKIFISDETHDVISY